MNRFLTILVPLAIAAGATAAESPKVLPFKVGGTAFLNGMSDNGDWASAELQAGETFGLPITVYNLNTGKPVVYTPQNRKSYTGAESSFVDESYSVVTDITDDGKILVGTIDAQPAYFTTDDLTWHELSMGSTTMNRNYLGLVYSTSTDGRVMCGWGTKGGSMTEFAAFLWIDGQLQTVTGLPTYKDLYDKGIIKDYMYRELNGQTPNYSFRQLSGDGKKMIIGIDHNLPGWGCSFLVYDVESGTYDYILPDGEAAAGFTNEAYISPNGKWVTGTIIYAYGEYEDINAPYLYNVDTKELQIFSSATDQQVLATCVGNDGTIYGGSPGSLPTRRVMIHSGNLWVDLEKALRQKYGYNYQEVTGYTLTGYFTAVSADSKRAVAMASMRDDAYAIHMPVDFVEAVKGVSLLDEFAVSPAAGSTFSRLQEVQIRFSYEAIPVNGAKAYVTDSKGNRLAETEEFTSLSSQNLLYSIKFPAVEMVKGEVYTVTLPAGSFVVPGTEMGNNEVSFSYNGRGSDPVKPISINPADNSSVMELSYTSPIRITFDSELLASTAVFAQLYEEGKENPITSLITAAEGKTLVIYPAASRKLSKDKNYTVSIPQGLASDLGKAGLCEAFDIHYVGTYEKTATMVDNFIFFDDFDDPGSSVNNMLLFEGDHRTPTDFMQSIGFDADNTPWNFSVRDTEASTDFVAASHSMYTNGGASDDWMATTQLTLPNENYFLSFQAQSYMKNKRDVLDIFIWEYDEYLNSLDNETAAKMKNEAEKLASITLEPMQDDLMEGSWKDYEFSLEKYSGKKIYVCFANRNENQSMIMLNNLGVEFRGDFTLTNATADDAVNATSIPVKVGVSVNNDVTYNEVSATLTAGDFKSEYKASGLDLKKGSVYEFTFPDELPLAAGIANEYNVSLTLGKTTQNFKGNVKNYLFDVNKRVLLEEGTGMWCGNCPGGEVAIEHLEETMPDNIAVISVHNDDRLAYVDYDQYLALGAYPKGRVNRSATVSQPLYNPEEAMPGQEEIDYSLTSLTGDVTFKDFVLQELETGTEAEIEIGDVEVYTKNNVIRIPTTVRFALNQTNVPYYIFTAVLEDGLAGTQTNYYSGINSKLLNWWTAQEGKVKWTYNNVARGVDRSFDGVDGRVPKNVEAGVDYESECGIPMPESVRDENNLHFVVALIDARTGRVVNTDVYHKDYTFLDKEYSSIEEISAEETTYVRLSIEGGRVLVNGDANVQLYDLSGRSVRNGNLAGGIYIVRKTLENGNVYTARVLVK